MNTWSLLIPVCFIWIGFVSAISFMEAWLKFRAPGVTVPIGLNIGRLVFNTLNKVEWAFALAAIALLATELKLVYKQPLLLSVPLIILVAQTFWLLPLMDKRAAMKIGGEAVKHSYLHLYYVGGELVKVGALLTLGINCLENV